MNHFHSSPLIERLESRRHFSVGATVYYPGGVATILVTGDDLNYNGFMTPGAPDTITVQGSPAPAGSSWLYQFIVSGTDMPSRLYVADNIEVWGYGGSDTITLTGCKVGTVAGGLGAGDTIKLQDCEHVTVIPISPAGEGAIGGPDGRDTIIMSNSHFCAASGGTGGDEFRVAGCWEARLYGDVGSDQFSISGFFALGQIWCGEGDDTLTVAMGVQPSMMHTEIAGEGGNDTINCSGAVGDHLTIIGGIGDDILKGGSGNDTIFANDNEIGNDHVYGGPGADTLHVDQGGEWFIEFDAMDSIIYHDVIV